VEADFTSAVQTHLDRLQKTGPLPVPPGVDVSHVSAAADFIKKQTANFFRGL
jgi:hypothetical protein